MMYLLQLFIYLKGVVFSTFFVLFLIDLSMGIVEIDFFR